ncbi:MAG: ferredoxin-type protein NapF [Gammaproteobacteria bacterium]|nr:ferredoxin-type protein NapF [Gammaproteobacteria bacterium]MCY4219618.1 ferredoxin-type protein NapF [Gammaproteobacteria bacterium]MCY4275479.1 ferredoxin-type protein NapF [Gammaproteobacteria bacterium]
MRDFHGQSSQNAFNDNGANPHPIVGSSSRLQTNTWRRGVQRPPWTTEDAVHQYCTSCGKCRDACPETILFKGPAGTPMLDFQSGACTFCRACVEACNEPVFFAVEQKPWNLIAELGESCLLKIGVSCRSCSDICDYEVLKFDLRVRPFGKMIVNNDSCTGCGACVSVCPSQAISLSPKS